MKVALVTHTYLPNYTGGRETFMFDLSKFMVEYGVDTELFVGDNMKYSTHDFYDGVKVHRFPMRTINIKGFPYRIVSPLLLRSLHRYHPDVIHCLCYRHFTTDMSIIYAKLFHTPIMMSIHGLGHFPTSFFEKLLSLYDTTIGSFMLRMVDRIVAYPFKDAVEPSIKRFDGKTKYINPAIDFRKFNLIDERESIKKKFGLDGCFVVLNVGRETVDDYKGQHFLMKAFKELDIPNSKLLIAGTKTAYTDHNIIRLGVVDSAYLGNLYQCADVFVQTSKFETCSRVVLEALCFGLPVISTKVGIAPYIIKENVGFLVEQEDYNGFNEALTKIYNGKIHRNDGKEYVKLFDWNKIVVNFIKVYKDLLEE